MAVWFRFLKLQKGTTYLGGSGRFFWVMTKGVVVQLSPEEEALCALRAVVRPS